MATGKKKTGGTGRREFLAGAGAALTFSAVVGFSGRTGTAVGMPAENSIASRIEHDSSLCAGCGVCSIMCSLYNEKEIHVSLSRSELVREYFEGNYSFNVCRQCLSPSCYQSCPKKDSALCIDKMTGIKYVNAEKCDGCAKCTLGCPLKPARIKLNVARKVAFKCDLCRNREKGPICIEYCSQHALAIVPGKVGV